MIAFAPLAWGDPHVATSYPGGHERGSASLSDLLAIRVSSAATKVNQRHLYEYYQEKKLLHTSLEATMKPYSIVAS